MRTPRLAVGRSLREGYRLTFRRFGTSVLIVLLVQGAVAVVASPLLIGLVGVTLRAAGLTSVTDRTIATLLTHPLAVALLVIAAVAVVLALLVQSAVFVRTAGDRMLGVEPRAASVLVRLGAVARRLVRRPSTLLLVPYLVLLVPLGHVSTGSLLTRWVAIPQFVTAELLKEPATAAMYTGLVIVLWYVNIRLLFTVPILVLTDADVPRAFARSWMFTRWRTIRVALLIAGVAVPGTLLLGLLSVVALAPTLLFDAVAPDAAPVAAAATLGILTVVVVVAIGLLLLTQAQVLVAALVRTGEVSPQPVASDPGSAIPRRALTAIASVGAVVAAGALTVQAIPAMTNASDGSTIVLAHRGWTAAGVENTVPALEGASGVPAEVVEMDIQQTADGGWVLMHDFDLRRLAGMNTSVAKLRQGEATGITVRADAHEARLPSLVEYLERAGELDQALLIEIKVHGHESPDYLEGLLELLEEHGGADQHIYHTLDTKTVEGLKNLRPDLAVGFIVPISFGGVPDTPADFLVLEEGAYSDALRERIQDSSRHVFVWTVQTPEAMRALFRDGVDGIITDHPDIGISTRTEVADDTGMTQRLADLVDRLITADG